MITIRVTADVKEDRKVELVLPPEVPVGMQEIVVTVTTEPSDSPKPRKASLSEWAKKYAEDLGDDIKSTDVEGFTGRRF